MEVSTILSCCNKVNQHFNENNFKVKYFQHPSRMYFLHKSNIRLFEKELFIVDIFFNGYHYPKFSMTFDMRYCVSFMRFFCKKIKTIFIFRPKINLKKKIDLKLIFMSLNALKRIRFKKTWSTLLKLNFKSPTS